MSQEQFEEIAVIDAAAMRGGKKKVVGEISAGSLVRLYEVPRRNHREKTGYQREVTKPRVNRLSHDLAAGRVDLPTAVLVNLREFDPDTNLIRREGNVFLRLNGERLYVVDGQHRVAALEQLVERQPAEWSSFRIPFVCMLGATEREEMEQFYVVNSTAKSVRTDLALDLLKQRAESDPDLMDALTERGETWKVDAQTIVEELANRPPWNHLVRFPGDPPGETVITSAGMVSSLKPLLATPYFGSIRTPNQLNVLEAYWRAIREVIPEAFEVPKEMTIQKATGVTSMHQLLIPVLEYIRSKGLSVLEPDSYVEAIQDTLRELEGDTADGGIARGAEFWRAGAAGAAGSFSSNAGRRVLIAKLRSQLPEVEVS